MLQEEEDEEQQVDDDGDIKAIPADSQPDEVETEMLVENPLTELSETRRTRRRDKLLERISSATNVAAVTTTGAEEKEDIKAFPADSQAYGVETEVLVENSLTKLSETRRTRRRDKLRERISSATNIVAVTTADAGKQQSEGPRPPPWDFSRLEDDSEAKKCGDGKGWMDNYERRSAVANPRRSRRRHAQYDDIVSSVANDAKSIHSEDDEKEEDDEQNLAKRDGGDDDVGNLSLSVAQKPPRRRRRRQRRDSVIVMVTKCKPRCRCRRRARAEYSQRGVRMRFGFLYNGYETSRRRDQFGFIAGWEAGVMIRKLFVTLAGSTITDAYLQILAAQLILIICVALQAFFKPYVPELLNILDTLGLFSLLCTQMLSIMYLYSETADRPILPPRYLDLAVTGGLFFLNAACISIFTFVWLRYLIDGWNICYTCISWRRNRWDKVRLITNDEAVMKMLTRYDDVVDGDDDNGEEGEEETMLPIMFWRHPVTSYASRAPPEVVQREGRKTGYIWTDEEGELFTTDMPQLLVPLQHGRRTGDMICMFYPKSLLLTQLREVPPDVMASPDDAFREEVDVELEQILAYGTNEESSLQHDAEAVDEEYEKVNHGNEDGDERRRQMISRRRKRIARRRQTLNTEQITNPMIEDELITVAVKPTTNRRRERITQRRKTLNSNQLVTNPMLEDETMLPIAPKGWVVRSHAKGYYFKHIASGKKQWHHPDDDAHDVAASIPRGWEKCKDDDEQIYYINKYSGAREESLPRLPAPPQGWITRPHAEYGHYFKHIETGKKQWEHPDDDRENTVIL
jgi:hypothetical protein